MSFLTDIDAGREKYRRRNERRSASLSRSRTAKNTWVVELGGFIEFVVSKVRKTDLHDTATAVQARRESPYISVLRRDLKGFLDWVCNKFPQKKKEYDPLSAAWERGRRGGV